MVYSMTAFARQESQGGTGAFTWELRSVNHRYLAIAVRSPEEFRFIEASVRAQVASRLKRGKVDCILHYIAPPEASLSLDEQVTRQVIRLCEEVDALAHHPAPLNSMEVLRWPGVLRASTPAMEQLETEALSILTVVLDELLEMRAGEGGRLAALIAQRCQEIRVILQRLHERLPEITSHFRENIQSRLERIPVELDPGRLEQELVLFSQRIDVAEELERLQAHVAEVENALQREEPIGRRLDFLMQELNREANTLAAKSADVEMSQGAVALKVLIEQMREQVQNIE